MNKLSTFFLGISLLIATSADALTLSSPNFADGAAIPAKYTCQGANISPAFQWSIIPPESQAFAFIVRDPDAPNKNWIHWVLYNIPLGTTSIPEGYQAKVDGTLVGENSWKQSAYQGPCPQSGTHHYRFELYALDQALYVDPNLTAAQLQDAMTGHIVGMASMTGTYAKH